MKTIKIEVGENTISCLSDAIHFFEEVNKEGKFEHTFFTDSFNEIKRLKDEIIKNYD